MTKTAATAYILVFLLSVALGVISRSHQRDRQDILDLTNQLKIISEKELTLSNMEKTLVLVYGLSKYEAHYYSIIFREFAEKDSVPWEVYPALIRIESNFNPTIMSPARCKGLTQVKEETGAGVAQTLGIKYNETTLWNDILNLVIGFTYFNDGYKEYRKTQNPEEALKMAIKRYCGGPGYSKFTGSGNVYVGEYKSTVWIEYIRMSYIYKGILYEQEHHK